MTARFRFIASNLHVGGGVQVGASLIDEIAALADDPVWADLVASTSFEVSSSVAKNALERSLARLGCEVLDRRPFRAGSLWRDLRLPCEASLVVFGPLYSRPRASRRILGYADVTSVYPSVNAPWRTRLRGSLSRAEASIQDLLLVETIAMADQVRTTLGTRAPRIAVISNAVNRRVLAAGVDRGLRNRVAAARGASGRLLAYPTRPYAHKNLDFLPRVAAALACRGVHTRFLLTLTDAEWEQVGPAVRSVSENVGELAVTQVPTLLRASDGVFFPSLLEAYSATPIEALAIGVPLFASDRDFVRSICGDAAVYFDPLDADSAAASIATALMDLESAERRRHLGLTLVAGLPSARQRAEALLAELYDQTLPAPEREEQR